jgi:hypothetical protein
VSLASAPVLDQLEPYTRMDRKLLLSRGFEDLVQALYLKSEVYGTTHPDTPIPYSPPLEDAFLPGADRIVAEIQRRLR